MVRAPLEHKVVLMAYLVMRARHPELPLRKQFHLITGWSFRVGTQLYKTLRHMVGAKNCKVPRDIYEHYPGERARTPRVRPPSARVALIHKLKKNNKFVELSTTPIATGKLRKSAFSPIVALSMNPTCRHY